MAEGLSSWCLSIINNIGKKCMQTLGRLIGFSLSFSSSHIFREKKFDKLNALDIIGLH